MGLHFRFRSGRNCIVFLTVRLARMRKLRIQLAVQRLFVPWERQMALTR